MDSHCDEHAVNRKLPGGFRLHISDCNGFYLVCSVNLLHYGIPQHLHIIQREQLGLKSPGAAQFVSAVNQIYLFTHSGKEDRILDGHISASGHGCHTVAEECSVAGGAV